MILVADDDVRLQKEMSGILGRAGWPTLVVGDGRAVVDAVRSREFDLVFLDVAMPGLNGLEALRILRARVRRPRCACSRRSSTQTC